MEDLITSLFEQFPVLATVVTGLLAAHALALFVVNLTPTPADDNFIKKFYTVIEWVAGITQTAKDKGESSEE